MIKHLPRCIRIRGWDSRDRFQFSRKVDRRDIGWPVGSPIRGWCPAVPVFWYLLPVPGVTTLLPAVPDRAAAAAGPSPSALRRSTYFLEVIELAGVPFLATAVLDPVVAGSPVLNPPTMGVKGVGAGACTGEVLMATLATEPVAGQKQALAAFDAGLRRHD